MRKSRTGKRKRRRRGPIIAALVFIGIMVLTSIGLFWSGDDPNYRQRHGDYVFDYTSRGWMTEINKEKAYFEYTPAETQSVVLPSGFVEIFRSAPSVWLTSSFNDTYQGDIAYTQLALIDRIISNGDFVFHGYTDYSTPNIPTIDCTNATAFNPVVLFEQGERTEVVEESGCYLVRVSSTYDLALVRTRLLYELHGIEIE